ncbi:MAG: hypothetical protein ABIN08_05375 [Caldimonas sp.]
MLGEVEPLLLGERGLQAACAAAQPGLALLADGALEHRLAENQVVLSSIA